MKIICAMAGVLIPLGCFSQQPAQPVINWTEEQLRAAVAPAFSARTIDLLKKSGFLNDTSLSANGRTVRVSLQRPPELLFQLYKEVLDGAYEQRTMFVPTLHPHVTGHRAPLPHLDQLIDYMQSKPGVWFATGERIARYLKDAPRASA